LSSACGDEGIRTPDLLRAREALSQLSYIPLISVEARSAQSSSLMTHCGPD
jgi:hypothetical protein